MTTLAFFISAGSAMTSMASIKVAKNTVAWVEGVKKQEKGAKAAEEVEAAGEAAAAVAAEAAATQEANVRQQVAGCVLSFVGGRYAWGGTDSHSGADCSDSMRHILSRVGDVSISCSSAERAGEGRTVTADSMQPGGPLFYSKGGDVNHAAMYIGNGRVVHVSSSKTGIIVSVRNHRTSMRTASYLN